MFARLIRIRQFFAQARQFSNRQLLAKFFSFIIIFSMLANTTPAAPSVMWASINEFGRDVRYAYLTSPTLAYLAEIDLTDNFIFAFFFGKSKQQSPERVVIQPGDLTVMQGEKINFSAIGLRNEQPLNGLKFQWSVTDVGRNRPARPFYDGNFEANKSGTFLIVAATNGSQAQVTVTVNPNEGFYLQQTLQKDEAAKTNQERQKIQALREKGALVTRDISTKNNYREQDEKQLDQTDKQKRNQARIRQNEIIRKNPNRGFNRKEVSLNQTPNQAEPEGIDRADAEGMVDESRLNSEKDEAKENTESKSVESALYRPAEEDGWGGGDWWTGG